MRQQIHGKWVFRSPCFDALHPSHSNRKLSCHKPIFNKLHTIANCLLLSRQHPVTIILMTRPLDMYQVVVLRLGESGGPLLASEDAPTKQEAFENMLEISARQVGRYMDMEGIRTPGGITGRRVNPNEQDGSDDDSDDSDDDGETLSTITMSLVDENEDFRTERLEDSMVDSVEHVGYQTNASSVGDEDEAGGSGGGQESSTKADDVPVATRLGNTQVGRGTSHANLPKETAADADNNHARAHGHRAQHLSNATSGPNIVAGSEPWMRCAGSTVERVQGPGNGPARRTATLPADMPQPPWKPLHQCSGNQPTGERARSSLPVKTQLRGQDKAIAPGTPSQKIASNNALPIRPTAVTNPTPKPPSLNSMSKYPTRAAACPQYLGIHIRNSMMCDTNVVEWNYCLAITTHRQDRGQMAKLAPATTSADGLDCSKESILAMYGRPTRAAMRLGALSYIRDHPWQFERWLDVYRPNDGDWPRPYREITVTQLRTTVTQVAFQAVKMQGGGVPMPEETALDVENYESESFQKLVSSKAAEWHMAGMGQIAWVPLFEIVVTDR